MSMGYTTLTAPVEIPYARHVGSIRCRSLGLHSLCMGTATALRKPHFSQVRHLTGSPMKRDKQQDCSIGQLKTIRRLRSIKFNGDATNDGSWEMLMSAGRTVYRAS